MRTRIGLVVPVMVNFAGFAEMMRSVDTAVRPYVIDNWNENKGVAKAWNMGIRESTFDGNDYTLVCNDDIIFYPGGIDRLIDHMEENNFLLLTGFGMQAADDHPDYDIGDFACFAVKNEEFTETYGWFDENIFPAYYEDNDMTHRMKRRGVVPMSYTKCCFRHEGSQTIKILDDPERQSYLFERNKAYYVRKWGGEPDYEIYPTPFNDPSKGLDDW